MGPETTLGVIVALPWVAALICLVLARLQVRLLGPRTATAFAQHLAFGGSALALLFVVDAFEPLRGGVHRLVHTLFPGQLSSIVIGNVELEAVLVADRLSACTALVIAGVFTLARLFILGPAGQRDLGIGAADDELDSAAAVLAVRRLGLLGLLEGAALLVVLAHDLWLAAMGWAVLGIGAAVAVAREVDDERRASAATRVLVVSLAGDLALGAAAVVLAFSGIGLAHSLIPITGDHLVGVGLLGLPAADLVALALISAAMLRCASMAWAGNSLAEAMLDAILVPIPAVYLLLRYQRVLAYAPSVLAWVLLFGMLLALFAVAVALVRPASGLARRSPRPGAELGLAGTGLAWTGLIAMAIGVGAWRTAVLLVLAQALGRLGLRFALLVADGDQLPRWTARFARVLCWAVAGIAPGLGFVAIAQTLLDVLTRTSLLAPWVSWPAALVVLLVAFAHAAAIARIWYEQLGRKPGALIADADEDGLDFAPLLLALVGLITMGLISLGAWFALTKPLLAWLDLLLPLSGGHEGARLGIRPEFRSGIAVARPWVAGSGVLVALVTGFAWMWARERFRRAHGGELSSVAAALELCLVVPRRIVETGMLVFVGLTELAARGVGRGVFEEGPRIATSLARDAQSGLAPRVRKLALGGPRQALLGIVLGLGLVLGWLYGKPEVASLGPSDGYGFGGLRPKLIRAGGKKTQSSSQAADAAVEPEVPVVDDASLEPSSTPISSEPEAPR